MNNKELQAAIDSLLKHLQSGSSYTSDVILQLKALFAIQTERAKEYVE